MTATAEILVRDGIAYLNVPDPELLEQIVDSTSFKMEGAERQRRGGGKRTDDVRTKLVKNNKFPAGLLDRVCRVIQTCNGQANVSYSNTNGSVRPTVPMRVVGVEPWSHQVEGALAAELYGCGIFRVPTGGGKALDVDTPIPTPSGWKRMGDVQDGDTVFDENGRQCAVLKAHPIMVGRPCYRVSFSDGVSVIADEDHLWLTETRTSRSGGHEPRSKVRTTKEIGATLVGQKSDQWSVWNHSVVVASALECPDADLPLDPYVLGAWLGDGDAGSAQLHTNVSEAPFFETQLQMAGYDTEVRTPQHGTGSVVARVVVFRSPLRGYRDNITRNILRELNVWNNKHVPDIYLRGSKGQRLALLQGLMDTDGHITKDGKAEFTTKLECLRDGVLELLRSLGYKPGWSAKTVRPCASSNVRRYGDASRSEYGPYYRIRFQPFADMAPVRMPHKMERLKPRATTRSASGRRQIVGVESADSVPVRCLTVDSPSHLYLAGEGMVPTHNTLLIAMIVAAKRRPAVIVVPTIDLLHQTRHYLTEHLAGEWDGGWRIGQLGDGVVDTQPVTVATIRTMAKVLDVAYESYEYAEMDDSDDTKVERRALKDWVESLGVVVIDEAHNLGARTLYDTVTKIPAENKFGMSASPWRDDGADLMIEAATGPAIFHVPAERLVKEGRLLAPTFRIINTSSWWTSAAWGSVCAKCKRQWLKWTPQCDCGCTTFRSQWMESYAKEIVDNPIRNAMIAQIVRDLDRATLILVKQVKHGRNLAAMIPDSVFLSGKDKGSIRQETFDRVRAGEKLALICTTIADQGVDLPQLGALVLAGGGKSSTRHLQRIGRVVRIWPGKETPIVVDLDDSHVHNWYNNHVHARRRIESAEWGGLATWTHE